MTISGFTAYVKQLWKNKPDTSTPLSADRLTHLEEGIKGNSDAIEKIATAVVDQIVNDPNKIASMAALYSVNQAVNSLNSDIVGYIDTFNIISNIIAGAEYTASQNCIIAGFMNLKMNTSCPVILNGLPVGYYSSPTDKNMYVSIYYPLKQGQVIKITPSDTAHEFSIKAFQRK